MAYTFNKVINNQTYRIQVETPHDNKPCGFHIVGNNALELDLRSTSAILRRLMCADAKIIEEISLEAVLFRQFLQTNAWECKHDQSLVKVNKTII